jgi:uracil-DNA glycosylase family 4
MYVANELNQPGPGRVLIVGRDPGEDETLYRFDESTGTSYPQGRPFVGKAGGILDEVLAGTGLRRQDVNLANVVQWRPENNDFKRHSPERVAEGVMNLQQLCERLKPSLIITLGNEAAHALVAEWPSSGRGIYGAKGIEERRGYFWDTRYGSVLTTLHPAGVLRKPHPGRYLLGMDFRRGRRWLNHQLPRDEVPPIQRLRSDAVVASLATATLTAWDVETKWDHTALLCSGYAGDNYLPYVATCPYEFNQWGIKVLQRAKRLVGHNGAGFDVPAVKLFYDLDLTGSYLDDTQQMWWAIEPDLAGTGDTDAEDDAVSANRMTRKGLAFLASLYFNLPWWKNYPDEGDPEHLEKMVKINGTDAFVTRWLADCLMKEVTDLQVTDQYRLAVSLYPATVGMLLRGIRVNEILRKQRQNALESRSEASRALASQAGLKYIEEHDVEAFAKLKTCKSCHNGKKKKLTCEACNHEGKLKVYSFNPFSPQQMKQFLYEAIGAPKNLWHGKVTTDSSALKKVLRWSRGQ